MDSSLSRIRSPRRYGWWLAPVFVVLALAGAWTARAAILRGAAEWWVISDPLDRADGILVLGGRVDVRPFAAADLYKRGFAPRILIANVMRDPLETMQLWPGQTALTRQLLLKIGVPAEAIIEFGDEVSSTYEEARAVLDWAKSSGAKSVIIPTDFFPNSPCALDISARSSPGRGPHHSVCHQTTGLRSRLLVERRTRTD